jgi:hypothetical protein
MLTRKEKHMRNTLMSVAVAVAMVLVLAGSALANNPVSDPLPVNGEPSCFGARVSHSANAHGLTPKAKIAATEGALAANPGVFPGWDRYYEENGVSVRTIQNWIRINCSENPIIPNP